MGDVSREDTFDLLEDAIAAMEEDLEPEFAAGDVTLTSLKAERDQYGALLSQGRAAERKVKAVNGELDDLKTIALGHMQKIRDEIGVVKGKKSPIYKRFPKVAVSGSQAKKTDTTTTGTS